jgi:hypothetical protein
MRKSSGPNKGNKQTKIGLSTYEKIAISRLRTNTAEFATVVRGAVSDSNSTNTNPQSYSFYLNYPGYYVNPASTIAQLPIMTNLIANEQKTFDEYKVTEMKVYYVPWVTGQVRVNTAVAFTAPVNPLLVMAPDLDDASLWSSDTKAYNAQNKSLFHRFSPGIFVCSQVQTDPIDARKWLNLQAIIPNSTTPPDPNNPAKTAAMKARVFGYQLTATTEGQFIVEWTVLMRGSYTLA